ncbi:MAG TPA: hypothetical protein VFW70_18625 [Methylomirabilota bacterium]|nr:hypothetical protein [Methylomirabilota bacterium]
MANNGSANSQQQGLQQAASMIFALVAVVPLLIFAYTLHTLGAIRSTQAQISLGLALSVALLGFWMFRSMLGRMAEVVQLLVAAVEQANRGRRPPGTPASGAPGGNGSAGSGAAAHASPVAGASGLAATPRHAAAASAANAAKRTDADRAIPGVGNIREIAEVARTMDVLWHREAAAHVGKRVSISVANSREPLIGTISEVSDDGLILDQADGQNAIAYRRVTGIDRLTGQG